MNFLPCWLIKNTLKKKLKLSRNMKMLPDKTASAAWTVPRKRRKRKTADTETSEISLSSKGISRKKDNNKKVSNQNLRDNNMINGKLENWNVGRKKIFIIPFFHYSKLFLLSFFVIL